MGAPAARPAQPAQIVAPKRTFDGLAARVVANRDERAVLRTRSAEMAHVIAFLLSPAVSYVTAQIYDYDYGRAWNLLHAPMGNQPPPPPGSSGA